MTILGIDYGRVHVGIALGHDEPRLALPHKTLSGLNENQLIDAIAKMIQEESVGVVVVGSPRAQRPEQETGGGFRSETEAFSDVLRKKLTIPVVEVDERFTSLAAGVLRREVPEADEHALAAMLIVDTYLDQQHE
ncbi:MAG: RuvX/YqgF family protein [Patescibacteria group bacterium]